MGMFKIRKELSKLSDEVIISVIGTISV